MRKILRYSRRNDDGQMSIFFAVVMVVLITLIAFIINVGLYVKGKINLQNAVDSAAFAGAAVQARQLSTIGYLNWEMRNVYKEWMFKYYVLGNLSIKNVANPGGAGENINFTMEQAPGNDSKIDKYNFPSVCIHFADTVDICRRYEIPGLPRFTNTALPGIDESSTYFVDEIVKKKSEDCSRRSQLNFYTTAMWAFGVPDETSKAMDKAAPKIASNRVGAYPAAVELAFRIRNLENIVNTVGMDSALGFNQGVCNNEGSSKGLSCNVPISSLTTLAYPHFERTVKAYYSAFRNLGNEDDDEMKGSFVLTELTPIPFEDSANFSMSNTFIPQERRQKYYVDLQLHTLNLVNFYSVFTATDGQNGGTKIQGKCMVSKVGMPVPGYPYGFVKSPNVLTYYAVKGEANFIGLFNPFKGYTKLTAYSAAKPFGGRIGPKTFKQGEDTSTVKARSGQQLKSATHILGIGITDTGKYQPGDAIPLSSDFWISDPDHIIGGWAQGGTNVRFALPNLMYDTSPPIDMQKHATSTKLFTIKTAGVPDTDIGIGLYDKEMMKSFKANLVPGVGGEITPESIIEGIYNVRAPTRFDAQNYLIPIPMDLAKLAKLDSFGNITGPPSPSGLYTLRMYAPLYNTESIFLYQNASMLATEIDNHIGNQMTAVNTYLKAMWLVAQRMRNQADNVNSLYYSSSDIISDDRSQGENINTQLSCKSMAGSFFKYFMGPYAGIDETDCPKPFLESLRDRWSEIGGKTGIVDFHGSTWKKPTEHLKLPITDLLTAYAPGSMSGSDPEAFVTNPFLPDAQELARRNFYSTKFITLKSVFGGDATYIEGNSPIPILSEGRNTLHEEEGMLQTELNTINDQEAGVDLKDINY